MSKTIIIHNPSHLATISYKNLKDLQGDLKTLTKENWEKLKQSKLKGSIVVSEPIKKIISITNK